MTEILDPISASRAGSPDGVAIGDLVHEGSVHRRVYTDPAIFDREMVRVFGGTWVYLGHESELPTPNSFRQTRLGLRPVILTRDEDGVLRALFNRCTHRGSTVCREERGTAKRFQCPYHSWTFANDGQLKSLPWPEAYGPGFDKSTKDLKQVLRLDTYREFIFGTLNPQAPTLRDYLGVAAEYLDAWLDRYPKRNVIVRSSAQRMVYNANWKLSWDNAADGYHPAFSHRSLLAVAARYGESRDMQYFARQPDKSPMYVKYLGHGHNVQDQRPAMSGGYWDWIRPMPGMEITEATLVERYGAEQAGDLLNMGPGAGLNLNIFPNLLIIGNHLQVVDPMAVDRTRLTWFGTTAEELPDELNTLRMRMQEDFPAFGEPDDLANFEEAQRGLTIPEIEWVDVSRGLGTDREWLDERGILTGPVTDEFEVRHYFEEWRRLMTDDFELAVR